MSDKKWFLGWENIKWVIIELGKVGSNKPSFFSKKRIESGIAFMVLIWGCVFWLIQKYDIMTTTDFLVWSTIPATIAGYIIALTERAKGKVPVNTDDKDKEEESKITNQ
jgi:hypothetical protein